MNLQNPDLIEGRPAMYTPEDRVVINEAGNVERVLTLRDSADAELKSTRRALCSNMLRAMHEVEQLSGPIAELDGAKTWAYSVIHG